MAQFFFHFLKHPFQSPSVCHNDLHVDKRKMGKSKKDSFVNKFGKCHDVKNIFIIDSSSFPSSSGVNIASTVQAVSLMISDNIKKNIKNLLNNEFRIK